jgi:hypothetical protein
VKLRLLAFVAIVVMMAGVAGIAVADKRHKTVALRHAHRVAWLCAHGRGHCGTLEDQIYRANIEPDWNHREHYYEAAIVAGLLGCGLLVGLEIRSRRLRARRLA